MEISGKQIAHFYFYRKLNKKHPSGRGWTKFIMWSMKDWSLRSWKRLGEPSAGQRPSDFSAGHRRGGGAMIGEKLFTIMRIWDWFKDNGKCEIYWACAK